MRLMRKQLGMTQCHAPEVMMALCGQQILFNDHNPCLRFSDHVAAL